MTTLATGHLGPPKIPSVILATPAIVARASTGSYRRFEPVAVVVSTRREGRYRIDTVNDPHILGLVEQVFAHVAPDGSLAPHQGSQPRRVRSLTRFYADAHR